MGKRPSASTRRRGMDVIAMVRTRMAESFSFRRPPRSRVVGLRGTNWKSKKLAVLECGHERLVHADRIPVYVYCVQCM